jgi:transposase-like protein
MTTEPDSANDDLVVEITSTEITPQTDPPSIDKIIPEPMAVDGIEAADKGQVDYLRRQLYFVRRRAEGATFAAIAAELGVAPSTLVNWSREYRQEIQNLRAMRMEALQSEMLKAPELRVRRLGKFLAEVEAELENRKLSELPTSRLFSLADTLRRRIAQETGDVKFALLRGEVSRSERAPEFVWKA